MFVRAHCAATDLAPHDPDRDKLDRKAAALFRDHAWAWYGRDRQPPGWKAGWHDLFRQHDRGVLTDLRVPGRLAHLVADLPGLFAAEPIGTVAFDAFGVRADHFRAVRRFPVPPRPVRLDFRPASNRDAVGYLAAVVSAFFASAVTAIDAAGCGNGLAVAQALARSPFLGNLRELTLDADQLGGHAAAVLVAAPPGRRLDRLTVTGRSVEPGVAVRLRDVFGDRLAV